LKPRDEKHRVRRPPAAAAGARRPDYPTSARDSPACILLRLPPPGLAAQRPRHAESLGVREAAPLEPLGIDAEHCPRSLRAPLKMLGVTSPSLATRHLAAGLAVRP
jgi:hypothetical protein